MRILTVRQPWAHAIIHGGKNVENRVRNLAGRYQGPVAIHAGMRPDDQGWVNAEAYRLTTTMHLGQPGVLGAIIGVVELRDVHRSRMSENGNVCFDNTTPIGQVCSRWADQFGTPGGFHLVLSNPRPLAQPIPFKGALGLRTLDPATIAAILEQL
jgi:hypothetical protein